MPSSLMSTEQNEPKLKPQRAAATADTTALPAFERQHDRSLIMAALCNRGPLYFCHVVSFYLLLSIFFHRLISAATDWMYTSTHGVALVRI